MTPEISPIEFGRLLNAVQNLTTEVESLRKDMSSMKDQITGARGIAVGLMLAAGGVGAGATHLIDKLWR